MHCELQNVLVVSLAQVCDNFSQISTAVPEAVGKGDTKLLTSTCSGSCCRFNGASLSTECAGQRYNFLQRQLFPCWHMAHYRV